jgi:hypothetical protein
MAIQRVALRSGREEEVLVQDRSGRAPRMMSDLELETREFASWEASG